MAHQEAVPASNIWEALLKDSSRRGRLPDGTALFLGDSGCGKSSLVRRLGSRATAGLLGETQEPARYTPDIIAYDSFIASDVEEAQADSISLPRVGVWSINEKTFDSAASMLLDPQSLDKLVLFVAVDLSKPLDCRTSLMRWLRALKVHMEAFYSHMSAAAVNAIKESNCKYLNERSGENTNGNSNSLFYNFGVPLIVIGCKSDTISLNDALSLKMHNEVQRDLRYICHNVGAALIYCSTATGTNLPFLKKYVLHRLYGDAIPVKLTIEHASNEIIVPAGLERSELISLLSNTEIHAFSLDCKSKHDNLQNEGVKTEVLSVVDNSAMTLEDEQAWLTSLQTALEQVAMGAIVDATSTAPSLLPNDPKTASTIFQNVAAINPGEPKKITRRSSTMSSEASKAGGAAPDNVRGFFESLLTK